MKYISFFVLIILFALACSPKDIAIDIPDEEPRIIVASQVLPNIGLVVILSNSISSLESVLQSDSLTESKLELLSKLVIEKAYVTLNFDGKSVKLSKIAPGVYSTIDLDLIENKNYTLYVKDSLTGREITATTTYNPPIELDSAVAKLELVKNKTSNDTLLRLNFELTDTPGQKNYYMLNYVRLGDKNDIKFGKFNFSNKGKTELFTSDNADENHKINIKKSLIESPTDTLVATLFKITKDYYEFQNSYKKREGFFAKISGEPISLPTNVVNGQGFFNMAYPSIKIIHGKW